MEFEAECRSGTRAKKSRQSCGEMIKVLWESIDVSQS